MSATIEEIKDPSMFQEAVDVISMAVLNDPNKVYYFPDDKKRGEYIGWIIKKIFKATAEYNRVFVCKVGSKVVGSSMWLTPGHQLSNMDLIKNGLLKVPFKFGPSAFWRIVNSIGVAEKIKAKHITDDKFWQLFYIGVHPEHQNEGIGTLLMKPILDEADKTKSPIFLENFTEANTRFYLRNGFDLLALTNLAPGIEMRNMYRKPGAEGKNIPRSNQKK